MTVNVLADFFSTNLRVEFGTPFFEKFEKLLDDAYGVRVFVVLSFSSEGHSKGNQKYRVLWNKSKIDKLKCSQDIESIVLNNEQWVEEDRFFLHDDYQFFHITEIDGQKIVGIGHLMKEIDAESQKLLDQFLTTQTIFFQQYRQLKMIEKLAYLDDATDLFNQRKLKIDLDHVIEQFKNYGQKFSLLFLDIDYFKTVNDNFGHIIGTELLSEVALVMRTVLRDIDWVYRYGGDEFVVIMTGIDPEAAKIVGDRILETIKSKTFKLKDEGGNQVDYQLSISIGVASCPGDAQTSQEILNMADKLMYQAKKSGRGRVCDVSSMVGTSKK